MSIITRNVYRTALKMTAKHSCKQNLYEAPAVEDIPPCHCGSLRCGGKKRKLWQRNRKGRRRDWSIELETISFLLRGLSSFRVGDLTFRISGVNYMALFVNLPFLKGLRVMADGDSLRQLFLFARQPPPKKRRPGRIRSARQI